MNFAEQADNKQDRILEELGRLRGEVQGLRHEVQGLGAAQARISTTLEERCGARLVRIETLERGLGSHADEDERVHAELHGRITALSHLVWRYVGGAAVLVAVASTMLGWLLQRF